MHIFEDRVPVDPKNGCFRFVDVLTYVLKLPPLARSSVIIASLVPYCKTLPFFKSRDLNAKAVAELLNSMTYKEVD